jgi:hypothetical protein
MLSMDVRSMRSRATTSGAYDKSVCDGKTRRALLWLSVPFERGNHTRSNDGGATARLTAVAEEPADAKIIAMKPIWRNPAISRPCLNGLPIGIACELRA